MGIGTTICRREDGTLLTAYIHMRKGKSARTEILIKNTLLLDRDISEKVLGIEILQPVSLETLLQVSDRLEPDQQQAFRNFVSKCAPLSLLKPD